MSDKQTSEMLMYLVPKKTGEKLAAESTVAVDTKADLMDGFAAGKFFEVESFSLGIELQDDEGGQLDEAETRSYARWRSMGDSQLKPNPVFRAEPGDMSVSRKIDAASPALLKHCLDSDKFDKAVLVRRRLTGVDGKLAVVLRLTLAKVWLRSIEWEDGDTVRETCKFRFSSLDVTYVQLQPGSATGQPFNCSWDLPEVSGG